MQIIEKKLEELKVYENNPRNNDKAVNAVAESILQFGFKVPIVIDTNDVIVCGHTRLKASKKLGLDTVPCIVADDLTEEQIKAFRLADNKTAELAEWDVSKLEEELKELAEMDFDMSAFEFDVADIEEPKEVVEDDVPDVSDCEPITQLGDIWKLGEHRLMCGDSTDKETVERLMDGAKADLLVTDPPYNVAYEGKTEDALTIENDSMSGEEFRAFLTSAFTVAVESLKEGASFYIWYANLESYNFIGACIDAGLHIRQFLIWNKNSMVLGRSDYQWKHEPCLYGWKDGAPHKWYSDRSQTTVLEFNRPSRNGEHPTMKPLDLIGYQIQNSSKKNDIVLDLFGGSGSTLIACEQLNRKCRTMELDPKYCDVIIKRWETLTGKKAELIKGE